MPAKIHSIPKDEGFFGPLKSGPVFGTAFSRAVPANTV